MHDLSQTWAIFRDDTAACAPENGTGPEPDRAGCLNASVQVASTIVDGIGAYTADRASALSGVPRSTIHSWARNDILVPSVSASRVKLWSFADLMAIRVVYWLRQQRTTMAGPEIPRTSRRAVRRAVARLRGFELLPGAADRARVWVNAEGEVYLPGPTLNVRGRLESEDVLDPIAPFDASEGLHGPDLVRPRPQLRIAPGKLGGSPHVVHTRVETRALAALGRDGFSTGAIRNLYPYLTEAQIDDALDLENQLRNNLALRSAA